MGHLVRLFLAVVVATAALVGVGSCSSGGSGGVPAGAVVLDVRTPAEYAAGHLAGAQNVDVEAPDFATRIATLDPAGEYLVYCRTGNRASLAASQMAARGFAHVTNLGGLEAAARTTGLSVVTH